MRATSRAGSALAATTLAAFFALGDAAEVTVKISYPDRDAGSTAALVLVATLVTLAVSMLVWMVLRRSASSTTRTSTSTTTAEQDVVNDNEEIDGNGWEVLTGDDDEEDTTAGAPAVGGHGRSAEGQAGSSAASGERPAVARRAGEAARASARQVAPRLADSLRLDAVTVPLSPAEKWLEDFVMLFRRDALRTELKRRGHAPTGLKRQLACRLVRDGSANAVSTESIWRLAALEAVSRTGRESSGRHRASILAALETEQSLVSYLRSRE